MHPIFQWLDYHYDDYGGFARVTDERWIGGFKNRLIVGVNRAQRRDRRRSSSPTGRTPRRARCCRARSTSRRTSRPTSRTPSTSCPMWPWSRARSSCTRRATAPTCSCSQRQPVGQPRLRHLEPEARPAVGGRSAPGRCSPTSRAAPRCRASARTRFTVHRLLQHQGADRHHLRDRHARPPPDYTWDLAAYRAEIANELQCLVSARSATAPSSMPTARCTRASRSASASPSSSRSSRTATGRPAVAQRRLHAQRLPLRRRCQVRRQRAAGRAAALPAQRAALQASAAALLRAQRRMGAAGLLRRQRQHAEDGALCDLGPQARLRQRRAVLRLHRGPQPLRRAPTSPAPASSTRRRRPCRCSSRAPAARSTAA